MCGSCVVGRAAVGVDSFVVAVGGHRADVGVRCGVLAGGKPLPASPPWGAPPPPPPPPRRCFFFRTEWPNKKMYVSFNIFPFKYLLSVTVSVVYSLCLNKKNIKRQFKYYDMSCKRTLGEKFARLYAVRLNGNHCLLSQSVQLLYVIEKS